MNHKFIEKLLGIILILAAIYSLDFSDWNKTAVFFMLSLSGASALLKNSNSEFYQKLSQIFRKTAFVIAIITIIKMLFFA